MRTITTSLTLLAGVAIAAMACSDLDVSQDGQPGGILAVYARSVNGQYVARPQAQFAFIAAPPTADSRSSLDTCVAGTYDPRFTIPEQMPAGDSVVFVAGSETHVLRPDDQFGAIVYASDPEEIPFGPGTKVTFTVPGVAGGFPAAALSSLTPAAITSLSPILAEPPLTEPLTVTWEPVGDDSSRFEVLLLYAVQGSQIINRAVACDWRDDGSGTIPAGVLGGWATSEDRQLEVSRYRTARRMIGDTLLYFIGTFDTLPPIVYP